ncbi:MAG: ion channel, partial [Cyanobacteria bacterium P01_D01_bin.71]
MRTSDRQKYRQLLITLTTLFALSPLLKAGIPSMLADLILLCTILLTVRNFALSRRLYLVYVAIAALAFCLQLSFNFGWNLPFNQTFNVLFQLILILYIGGAAYLIGRDIFTVARVTADTVQGGISVYLLIGFAWALLYGTVATLDPDAFSQSLLLQDSYLKAFHFSFTTLTTLGYGDIIPVSEVALVLANLEAIIGQIYP